MISYAKQLKLIFNCSKHPPDALAVKDIANRAVGLGFDSRAGQIVRGRKPLAPLRRFFPAVLFRR